MDDLEPVPSSDMPEQEVPAADLPHDKASGAEVPSGDLPEEFQPAPTTSTLGAGIEGVAKGLAGPLATGAELGLSKMGVPGLSAEEQTKREEEHPYAHWAGEAVGLVAPAILTGGISAEARLGVEGLSALTQGELIGSAGKAAAAAAKSVGLQKTGQTALKLGIEGGLFHLSDNVSKMILGQTDPEAPVASFLAGTPSAVLLGGVLGGVGGKAASKLQEFANGKTANAASKWLADLGSRFDLLSKHGGLEGTTEAATDQAQHLFDTVSSAVDEGFSLKRDSIDKLTENLDPAKVTDYINNTRAQFANLPRTLMRNSAFRDAMAQWESNISTKADVIGAPLHTPSAGDIFEATDAFKRRLGDLAKFDSPRSSSVDQAMGHAAGKLYHSVRTSLENPEVWGDMGKFQKNLNSAYSSILTPMKDFSRSAGAKVGDELQIDPGKLFNVFRQLGRGKLSADIRAQKIANFFEPAQKFLKTVSDLHSAQGLESNIPAVATDVLDEMLKREPTAGAKVASWLFDSGQSAVGMAGSHVTGTIAGGVAGHPYLGYRAGEALYPLFKEMGKKPTRWAVSAALRAVSSGEYSGIPEAINYAEGINKGAQKIENSINNVFRIGGKTYSEAVTDAQREAIKKFVAEGKLNQEIQNQKNQGSQKSSPIQPTPAFAHGGEVLAPELAPTPKKHLPKATNGADKLSAVFPEQTMLLGMAKGRVNNYLNSVRPGSVKFKAPFDEDMPDHEHERKYNRAIDIAANPLSVLDHIKRGTIEPEHVQHLEGMYPEMANHLRKKITEKMTEAQMKNEKPDYRTRQGLSLFMGSALDSNLSPQNIQAAQATFAVQKANAQMAAAQTAKPKKGTASLENEPNQYRTSQQSAQMRQSHLKP